MQRRWDVGREILKWIALITMTVDHLGAVLYPEYTFMRIIGRLSFPLYGYLLVLGKKSTQNVKNYITRLLVFAIISQVPFHLALSYQPFEQFNIFFTLSLGLLSLLKPLLILPTLLISELLHFDYGGYGVLLINGMYVLSENTRNGIILLLLLNAAFILQYNIQMFALLALPIILLYKKGSVKKVKEVQGNVSYPLWRQYFFYIYYPLHLSIIYFLRTFSLK